MASASSKTLIDIFGRASKRMKPTLTTLCKSEDNTNSSSTLTVDQKSRIEHNKNLALSKKNRKICIERVSKHKGMLNLLKKRIFTVKKRSFVSNVIALSESLASGSVKLKELLVEESWLKALAGEFQKDYVVNLSKFVETEICKDDYVYPPQHLIFNALNTTPFQSFKLIEYIRYKHR
jgi:uracil-DNA glycosylase